MDRTYGVIWRHRGGAVARGRLELGGAALRRVGTSPAAAGAAARAYADLVGVHVGRRSDERIDGLRTVVLERCDGDALAIAGIVEPGIVSELADRLTTLQHSHASRHVAIILPLVPGSQEAVRELLAAGPPFQAAELGLDRHCVFVTQDEVVFVFAWHGEALLEGLLTEPALWERAAAWQEHVAGPPRIADPAYLWSRPSASADAALLPPGLHD